MYTTPTNLTFVNQSKTHMVLLTSISWSKRTGCQITTAFHPPQIVHSFLQKTHMYGVKISLMSLTSCPMCIQTHRHSLFHTVSMETGSLLKIPKILFYQTDPAFDRTMSGQRSIVD
jgi:hypothetical protein